MKWRVSVEARAPEEAPAVSAPDEKAAAVLKALQFCSGAASADERSWSAVVSVSQPSAGEAVKTAEAWATGQAVSVGFPNTWPVVRLEVLEESIADAELAEPPFPDVVGASEVLEMLDISKQRLHKLRTEGRFPRPMIELASGPIWLRAAVASFEQGWSRRPGRPQSTEPVVVRLADSSVREYVATRDVASGIVRVPVSDAAAIAELGWILNIGLDSVPEFGTSGRALFLVPRTEWARRIDLDGNVIQEVRRGAAS